MANYAITACAVFLMLELFAAGTAVMAKKCGEEKWKLAFIPVYSFAVLQKLTGAFTVLSIPMKKYGSFVFVLVVVSAVAGLLAVWSGTLRSRAERGFGRL